MSGLVENCRGDEREPTPVEIMAMRMQGLGSSSFGPENPTRQEWEVLAELGLRALRQEGFMLLHPSEITRLAEGSTE